LGGIIIEGKIWLKGKKAARYLVSLNFQTVSFSVVVWHDTCFFSRENGDQRELPIQTTG
jgi:hypothetical protein